MSTLMDSSMELLEQNTKFWLAEQIRHQLRQHRIEQNLTQEDVAERLDKNQVFVSNCESGRRRIDPVELLAFATVYGVSIDSFFEQLDVEEALDRDYSPIT